MSLIVQLPQLTLPPISKDGAHDMSPVIAEFSRLQSLGAALLPSDRVRDFNRRLGAALHASFKMKADTLGFFSPLEKLIFETVQNRIKLKLLVITILSGAVLLSFGTWAYFALDFPPFIHTCTISATGGLAGALISTLERSRTTKVGEGDLGWFTVSSSISRILLGGLFGVISFAAADADLAFSLFKSSKPALLILGVAAGFSERLIPDMLGSINDATKSNGDETLQQSAIEGGAKGVA